MIVPYLHERKLILNRPRPNTKMFFNLLDVKDYSLADSRLFRQRASSLLDSEHSSSNVTTILCMNLTDYRYHNYLMNGLLINRVDFSDLVRRRGIPVAVSPNGRVFVFNKSYE